MDTSAVIFDVLGCVMFIAGSYLLYRRLKILRMREKRTLLSEYLGVQMLIICLLFIAVATVMIYLLFRNINRYCNVTIWICIVLYTGNKVFLYLYLIEKAHIVNCVFRKFEKRGNSSLYLFNIASVFLYAAVITIMILYRKSDVEDGQCYVGLKDIASSTLLIFDSIYRSYLMSLFMWPLVKHAYVSDVIMDMAKKNVFGSVVSLLFSFANAAYMLVMHGNQMASMCLFLCTVDVFVDVLIMDWLLATPRDKPLQEAAHDLEVVKMDSVVRVTHSLVRPVGGAGGGRRAWRSSPLPRPLFSSLSPCRSDGSRSSSHLRVTFADDVFPSPDNSCGNPLYSATPRTPPPLSRPHDSHSPSIIAAALPSPPPLPLPLPLPSTQREPLQTGTLSPSP